jgi:hypothetical protein
VKLCQWTPEQASFDVNPCESLLERPHGAIGIVLQIFLIASQAALRTALHLSKVGGKTCGFSRRTVFRFCRFIWLWSCGEKHSSAVGYTLNEKL